MKASVVIAAHDEAASIGALLEALLGHDSGRHPIEEIVVYDDGSTDATASIVVARAKSDGRIRLLRGSQRRGRAAAWRALSAAATGDAIVKFDADVLPRLGAVAALCDALCSGATMSFGVCEPVRRRKTFVSRGAAHAARLVQELQRGDRAAEFAVGRIIALRADAARALAPPDEVTNDDHWLSLKVRERGGRVALAPSASCGFVVPDTFDDYRRQSNRVREGERQLERVAGLEPVRIGDLLIAIARCAAADPIGWFCWAAIYAASLLTTFDERPEREVPIRSTKALPDESAARR